MAKRNARNLIIIKDWIFSLLKQFNFLLNIQKDYKLLMKSYEKLKVIPKVQKWSQKPSRSFLFLFICFMFVLFFSFYILSCSLRGPATQHLHKRGAKPRVVWMDGWVDGWVVIFYQPSIFLIFKYDNKHDVLIPKICLKVASAF